MFTVPLAFTCTFSSAFTITRGFRLHVIWIRLGLLVHCNWAHIGCAVQCLWLTVNFKRMPLHAHSLSNALPCGSRWISNAFLSGTHCVQSNGAGFSVLFQCIAVACKLKVRRIAWRSHIAFHFHCDLHLQHPWPRHTKVNPTHVDSMFRILPDSV